MSALFFAIFTAISPRPRICLANKWELNKYLLKTEVSTNQGTQDHWTKRGFWSPKWGICITMPSKFGVREWKSQNINWQPYKSIAYLQHAGNPHVCLTLSHTLQHHLCTGWRAILKVLWLKSKYGNNFPPPFLQDQWAWTENSAEERKQSLSHPEGPEYSIIPWRRSRQSPSLGTRKLGQSQVLPQIQGPWANHCMFLILFLWL